MPARRLSNLILSMLLSAAEDREREALGRRMTTDTPDRDRGEVVEWVRQMTEVYRRHELPPGERFRVRRPPAWWHGEEEAYAQATSMQAFVKGV